MPAELTIRLDDKRLRATMNRFMQKAPLQRRRGMLKGGAILRRSVSTKIRGEGFVRNPSRSSKYPGVLSGTMLSSLFVKVNQDGTEMRTGPGPNAPYASYLEFGTRHMPRRPFMADSLKEELDKVMNAIFGEIVKPLKR